MTPKEKPILFSGPMVRAILAGRKTMTRRLVKLPNPALVGVATSMQQTGDGKGWIAWYGAGFNAEDTAKAYPTGGIKAPYAVGDVLWVRETWQIYSVSQDYYNGGNEADEWHGPIPKVRPDNAMIVYAATDDYDAPWRPSIHMPRWASRLRLRVVETRKPERIQDMTNIDAVDEGWPIPEVSQEDVDIARLLKTDGGSIDDASFDWFADLWETINGPGAWDRNDWVWPIRFEVTP